MPRQRRRARGFIIPDVCVRVMPIMASESFFLHRRQVLNLDPRSTPRDPISSPTAAAEQPDNSLRLQEEVLGSEVGSRQIDYEPPGLP